MHNLYSKCVRSEAGGNWHNGKLGYHPSWLGDENMMLICKTVGNMNTNWGKYDNEYWLDLTWEPVRSMY